MKPLFRSLAVLTLLAACAGDARTSGGGRQAANSQAPTPEQIETAIVETILRDVPAYAASKRGRALAACIDWTRVTFGGVSARHASWAFSGQKTDTAVLAARLMESSLRMCRQSKTQVGSRCDCVGVAVGNQSVLRVPDEVMRRLVEEGTPEALIKCRLADGVVLDVSARKCEEVGGAPK